MTLYQKLQNEMEGHREFWNYYGVNFEVWKNNPGM